MKCKLSWGMYRGPSVWGNICTEDRGNTRFIHRDMIYAILWGEDVCQSYGDKMCVGVK